MITPAPRPIVVHLGGESYAWIEHGIGHTYSPALGWRPLRTAQIGGRVLASAEIAALVLRSGAP